MPFSVGQAFWWSPSTPREMLRLKSLPVIAAFVFAPPALESQQTQKPGEGVWRNYDFVPGDTVWVATDFANEPVGRFPASQLEFVKGNAQIVEIDSAKALEVSNLSVFRVALPRQLAREFSLEFEIRLSALHIATNVYFSPLETSVARYPHDYLYVGGRPGIYRAGREVSNMTMSSIINRWVPVRLQVDSAYAIMYVGSERVAQVPTSNFARSNSIEFHVNGNDRVRTYIRNIVVAVGLNDLYRTLSTTGSFTTLGILFDTDRAELLPESTPVLEQLRKALAEHPDLSVTIEGNTDSQGDDAHNLDLSTRRANAVVGYLTGAGIAASRLSAIGKGETSPVADNATSAGRRQNRRVVILKR